MNTQEIQEWEADVQNVVNEINYNYNCDYVGNTTLFEIISKVLDQQKAQLEERHKGEIELYFSKLGATDKTYEIYQDIKKDVLNILSKYE